MTTHVYTRKLSLLMALILSVVPVISAQQQAAKSTDGSAILTQPMPVDPQITMGQFKNGLRYYIRTTRKPEKRAELRLVVKAGSILEDDDQLGLAHARATRVHRIVGHAFRRTPQCLHQLR
jgi:zinc protease